MMRSPPLCRSSMRSPGRSRLPSSALLPLYSDLLLRYSDLLSRSVPVLPSILSSVLPLWLLRGYYGLLRITLYDVYAFMRLCSSGIISGGFCGGIIFSAEIILMGPAVASASAAVSPAVFSAAALAGTLSFSGAFVSSLSSFSAVTGFPGFPALSERPALVAGPVLGISSFSVVTGLSIIARLSVVAVFFTVAVISAFAASLFSAGLSGGSFFFFRSIFLDRSLLHSRTAGSPAASAQDRQITDMIFVELFFVINFYDDPRSLTENIDALDKAVEPV